MKKRDEAHRSVVKTMIVMFCLYLFAKTLQK